MLKKMCFFSPAANICRENEVGVGGTIKSGHLPSKTRTSFSQTPTVKKTEWKKYNWLDPNQKGIYEAKVRQREMCNLLQQQLSQFFRPVFRGEKKAATVYYCVFCTGEEGGNSEASFYRCVLPERRRKRL